MDQTRLPEKILNGEEIGRIMYESHKEPQQERPGSTCTRLSAAPGWATSFETVIPFVSASQNAAQAVGRMVMNDPTIPLGRVLLGSRLGRPTPSTTRASLRWPGWSRLCRSVAETPGINSISLNVGSANVLFPDSGFGPFFRPGPVVGIPASLMMKHGLLVPIGT